MPYAQLFKKNEIDTNNADASELYRELATGAMPKGSKRLDDCKPLGKMDPTEGKE